MILRTYYMKEILINTTSSKQYNDKKTTLYKNDYEYGRRFHSFYGIE